MPDDFRPSAVCCGRLGTKNRSGTARRSILWDSILGPHDCVFRSKTCVLLAWRLKNTDTLLDIHPVLFQGLPGDLFVFPWSRFDFWRNQTVFSVCRVLFVRLGPEIIDFGQVLLKNHQVLKTGMDRSNHDSGGTKTYSRKYSENAGRHREECTGVFYCPAD